MKLVLWTVSGVLGAFFSASSVLARASNPVVSPSSDIVHAFCHQVESYQPGSNHFFVCLQTGEKLVGEGVTGQQLISGICDELSDLFYDESSVSQCYRDGYALLGE